MRCTVFLVGALMLCASFAQGSEGVKEVIKLEKGGSSEDAMTSYVKNSNVAYNLTADDITKLEKAGVPATTIMAMVDRGKELRGMQASSASVSQTDTAQGERNGEVKASYRSSSETEQSARGRLDEEKARLKADEKAAKASREQAAEPIRVAAVPARRGGYLDEEGWHRTFNRSSDYPYATDSSCRRQARLEGDW